MKLLLLLTAITSVVGFLPKGAVRQTTPMEMVSFGFGGPESGFATPDPTRKVALPKPGDKNNVLIDPDLKFPAAIGAYSAGALMMYPCKQKKCRFSFGLRLSSRCLSLMMAVYVESGSIRTIRPRLVCRGRCRFVVVVVVDRSCRNDPFPYRRSKIGEANL